MSENPGQPTIDMLKEELRRVAGNTEYHCPECGFQVACLRWADHVTWHNERGLIAERMVHASECQATADEVDKFVRNTRRKR